METGKYDTLSDAVNGLNKRGYTEEIKVENGKLKAMKSGKVFDPTDLIIVEHHRYEGDSDPGDMSVIYAMESSDGMKGTFIDAFGTYDDPDAEKVIRQIKIEEKG